MLANVLSCHRKFQSTLPVRGATGTTAIRTRIEFRFQSTLPVRGATILPTQCCNASPSFQSTLPVRGATFIAARCAFRCRFQSTLPVRGATSFRLSRFSRSLYFNPRSPCGERRYPTFIFINAAHHFNPRSPCGERRLEEAGEDRSDEISIHAPRAGSDR